MDDILDALNKYVESLDPTQDYAAFLMEEAAAEIATLRATLNKVDHAHSPSHTGTESPYKTCKR